MITDEILKRFWSKVEKTATCWLWKAAKDSDGYGNWSYSKKWVKPHRFSFELINGVIPKGLVVDHICRVRNCVNPEHLKVVTQRENVLSSNALSALNSRKTHCSKEHEFNDENTKVYVYNGKAKRYCIPCGRTRAKEVRGKIRELLKAN